MRSLGSRRKYRTANSLSIGRIDQWNGVIKSWILMRCNNMKYVDMSIALIIIFWGRHLLIYTTLFLKECLYDSKSHTNFWIGDQDAQMVGPYTLYYTCIQSWKLHIFPEVQLCSSLWELRSNAVKLRCNFQVLKWRRVLFQIVWKCK